MVFLAAAVTPGAHTIRRVFHEEQCGNPCVSHGATPKMSGMTDGPDPEDRARSIFERLRSGGAAAESDPNHAEAGHDRSEDRPPERSEPDAGVDHRPEATAGLAREDSSFPSSSPSSDGAPYSSLTIPPPPPPAGPSTAAGQSDTPSSPPHLARDGSAPQAPRSAPGQSSPNFPRVAVPPDLDDALKATIGSPLERAPAVETDDAGGTPADATSLPLDEYGRPRHPGSVQHPLPRCLAVANQKGGVGKTTTTVNLGASLAELGYRVLVVDLDPQGNATTGLGVNGRNLDSSVYDVILHDVPIEDVIEPTSLRNLFVVPATIDLAGAEIELVPVFSRELRLRRALETIESDFDFVLIDCPPSLGLLTVNALAAAGEVLVPIQCEYYALEGLSQLLRNVNLVKSNLNNRLEVSTIVLTMYDARTKLAEQVADEVREHFGNRVCRNVVPRTVRLSEAPSFGQPVTTFDSSSRGAIAYRELAKEVSGGAPQRIR